MVPQNFNNYSFSTLNYCCRNFILLYFIFGGGLFTLITRPPPSAYVNGNFYFLYPSLSSQFISDTVISVILYGFGFIGLFAIYQSTKSAYNPRQAYMMLIIGVAFLLLSYIFLEGAIAFKTSGGLTLPFFHKFFSFLPRMSF